MLPTIRRMLEGTATLRRPEDGGGASASASDITPTGGDSNAGGTPAEPEAGSQSAEPGTAAGETPEGGANSPEGQAAGEVPPAASQPDPAQRRVNQLVAERWAERRRAEAAEQQSRLLQEQLNQTRQALQAQPQVDADGNPIQQHAQPQPRPQPAGQDLQAMAAQIAAQNEFNRQVEAEVLRGRGVHQDFDQVAATLQQFGELPRTFVEAALATGKGADVMYALGKDTLEANRILSLPPMGQAVALAQLAGGLKAPEPKKTVTSAPAPITPKVGGGQGKNTPTLEDPNMPVADWIKQREKELAANKAGAGNRRASR